MNKLMLVGLLSSIALGAWACSDDDDDNGGTNGGNTGGSGAGNAGGSGAGSVAGTGASDAGGTGGGEGSALSAACLGCLGTECASELAECRVDTDSCAPDYNACIDLCDESLGEAAYNACLGECATKHAGDVQKLTALLTCLREKCAVPCSG